MITELASSVDWNSNILQIRDSIIGLKEELQSADPTDRLDSIANIIQCIEFMKQSNIGWASLFTNPQQQARWMKRP